jgi:hypothetical protein
MLWVAGTAQGPSSPVSATNSSGQLITQLPVSHGRCWFHPGLTSCVPCTPTTNGTLQPTHNRSPTALGHFEVRTLPGAHHAGIDSCFRPPLNNTVMAASQAPDASPNALLDNVQSTK